MNTDTRLSDVLHVLLHMAQADMALTSEVLARSMGTNPAVFRRTMAGLREAGLVDAKKGPGGGWRLVQPLERITLLPSTKRLVAPPSSPSAVAANAAIAVSKGTSTPSWPGQWPKRGHCSNGASVR